MQHSDPFTITNRFRPLLPVPGVTSPAFRTDSRLSRISDAEMMRVNLEFSSGLAAWFSDRVADREKINRRVRAASHLLRMPWRANRQEWLPQAIVEHGDEVLETLRAQAPIWHEYDEPPNLSVRGEANLMSDRLRSLAERYPVVYEV